MFGGGFGYKAAKGGRRSLDLLGGFDFDRDQFGNRTTRSSAEFFWGDEWQYKVSGATTLRQSYRMFHNLSHTGIYRMNFDLGAATTLRKWLAWQVTLSDRYLSDPVPGRKKNDLLFTTGFRVTFAR